VVEVSMENWDFDAAAVATNEAMRVGADVIFQATFVDGPWRGRADFLLKVEAIRNSVHGATSRSMRSSLERKSRRTCCSFASTATGSRRSRASGRSISMCSSRG
jgi:hypothetical protein